MMAVAEIRSAYDDEREEFWAFAQTLSDEDRAHPSLCAGWTIADVIDHVAGWERLLGFDHSIQYPGRLIALSVAYLRARGSTDRLNGRLLQAHVGQEPAPSTRHLVDRLAPGSQLAELVIHHQDIRRPLDRPRTIPVERLRLALNGLRRLPGFDMKHITRGRRWEATDLGWSIGTTGPLTSGHAEPVLLALAGRTTAYDELTTRH